jgi:type I restriction enzyme M protein
VFIVNRVSGASLHCINFGAATDPCCGSGGMFVQSIIKFVEQHNGNRLKISVIGQESNPDTWRLAKMNLAIRGISYDLGERATSTFIDDQHKDIKVDFIMANPPFNLRTGGAKTNLSTITDGKAMRCRRQAMPTTRGFCICSQNLT